MTMQNTNDGNSNSNSEKPALEARKASVGAMPQQLEPNARIQIGQRIYTGLYNRGHGVVVAIHGEQAPETIRGGVIRMGGRAYFDIIFGGGEQSTKLPESILRGVQWTVFDDVADAGELLVLKFRAEQYEEDRKAQKADEEAKHALAMASLRVASEFAHLGQTSEDVCGSALVVKNIRKDLKKHFPGVKFSVRTDHNSARIRWTDGPTQEQVDELVGRYEAGSFNGMTDCYEYSRSPWGDVFGSIRYTSTNRDRSDELIAYAIEEAFSQFGDSLTGIEKPTTEAFKKGELWNVRVCTMLHRVDDLQSLVATVAAKIAVVEGRMIVGD